MTQEAICENTGGINVLVGYHVHTNSQYILIHKSHSLQHLQRNPAVGLDGKTILTTSSTNSLTKMKSQWTGEVKPAVELLY